MWTDAGGRDWNTSVTVTTIKRVQSLVDVLLTDVTDTDLIDRLHGNVVLLANVLYAVCKPQADERHVTDEQFGELLVGDTIDRACTSLMEDISRFFPSGRRPIVQRLWTAAAKLEKAKLDLLDQKLTDDQLTRLIQRQAEIAGRQIDTALAGLGDGSGDSPASSE